ncbi:MAG: hypothetical protein H7X85_01575 [Thermoanaerobaculia bacterium]|nr:hypothetical protein [Thermoanaerobaculia bacterium]
MRKGILALVLGGIVAAGVAVAQKAEKPTKVTCTITKTTVDKCCCVEQKDGKLYCTLAKQTVDPCCCKPAEK